MSDRVSWTSNHKATTTTKNSYPKKKEKKIWKEIVNWHLAHTVTARVVVAEHDLSVRESPPSRQPERWTLIIGTDAHRLVTAILLSALFQSDFNRLKPAGEHQLDISRIVGGWTFRSRWPTELVETFANSNKYVPVKLVFLPSYRRLTDTLFLLVSSSLVFWPKVELSPPCLFTVERFHVLPLSSIFWTLKLGSLNQSSVPFPFWLRFWIVFRNEFSALQLLSST